MLYLATMSGVDTELYEVARLDGGLYSPFVTYLLRSYMIALSEEFVEAAKIDGASNFHVFWYIIMPLSWPGFLTAGLAIGLNAWNEFLFAITFLSDTDIVPLLPACSLFRHVSGAIGD